MWTTLLSACSAAEGMFALGAPSVVSGRPIVVFGNAVVRELQGRCVLTSKTGAAVLRRLNAVVECRNAANFGTALLGSLIYSVLPLAVNFVLECLLFNPQLGLPDSGVDDGALHIVGLAWRVAHHALRGLKAV